MPGAVANMGREYVPAQPAQPLIVDDVKLASDSQGRLNGKRKDARQRVGTPCGDRMEMNPGIVFGLDFVGEDVHFVLARKPRCQFDYVPAVSFPAAVVVHDEGDLHVVSTVTLLPRRIT